MGPVDGAFTGPVAYTATVNGASGTPTGSVDISDGSTSCSATLDSSGSGTCSLIEDAANLSYSVTASYLGDGTYAAATSQALFELVGPADPTMTLSGAVTGDSGGVDTVLYSFTVSGADGATIPTGLVTVSDNNSDSCSDSLDSTGSGSCSLSENLADGPFTVAAAYGGDSNYNPATASPTPTVTVTDNSGGVETGGSLVFTAAVAGVGPAVTPTGTVSWVLSGGSGSLTSATSTLASDGSTTCTVPGVDATTYGAIATYSGDSNFAGASGSDSTATVGPAALTITASDGSMTYGGTPPTITAGYGGLENGDTSPSTPPKCSTTATSLELGRYLSLFLLGGGRPELQDQLRERVGDGQAGRSHHHRLRRLDDLRRHTPDHHGRLRRPRERGHTAASTPPKCSTTATSLELGRQLIPLPARGRATRTTRSAT